jgi:hypothetical protein
MQALDIPPDSGHGIQSLQGQILKHAWGTVTPDGVTGRRRVEKYSPGVYLAARPPEDHVGNRWTA